MNQLYIFRIFAYLPCMDHYHLVLIFTFLAIFYDYYTDMAELNDDHLQLCFNRTHFQRSDFNVERFVNLTRKRATLDQLQNDLRLYLRHLQNAMIELINDDYADFVNLSSSLASLRESIDKITVDVKSNWSTFFSSIAELEKCADTIENNIIDLIHSQKEQTLYRNKLLLLQSIQFLHTFINESGKNRKASWYSRLALLISVVEFWSDRNKVVELPKHINEAKARCVKKIRDVLLEALVEELSENSHENTNLSILILLLQLIDEIEYAIFHVVNEVINKKIGSQNFGNEKNMDNFLTNLLDQVLKAREVWVLGVKRQQQFTREVINFMDTCLLNFIISILEERFAKVLIPTDARLFHKCYGIISNFITTWPVKGTVQRSLFRTLQEKFNLDVYFKLASQPLLAPLKEHSEPNAFKSEVTSSDELNSSCLLSYSNSFISTLNALYSAEVFLPSLADKFWEFTLQRLEAYIQWVEKLIMHFSRDESPEEEKSQLNASQPRISSSSNISSLTTPKPTSEWLSLAVLYRDLQLFDVSIFQFCLNTVWTLLRKMHVDTTPFGQCISHFSGQLAQKKEQIDGILTHKLMVELTEKLTAITDIPRQYRWTKKPLPVGFSPYLKTAFNICETFTEKAQKLGWNDEEVQHVLTKAIEQSLTDFCERAEKVLESVEQTGSSLLRFKQRKGTAAGQQQEGGTGETDEAKIRLQIRFDADFVRQRAMEYGVARTERLEQIGQRAEISN